MPSATHLYLPLQFKQLVDLVKTLPTKEKQQLINELEKDMPDGISEWQKQEVRKRIKKYNEHPEMLINEKEALKIIEQA